MTEPVIQRARSQEAKAQRQEAILQSARSLALAHGVRAVTLTGIAAGVGMHKSAMLRYFETREEIFLRLAREFWGEWAEEVEVELGAVYPARQENLNKRAAQILSSTLVSRPLFCDLLAQVPLNLEHGVSLTAVKDFKIAALAATGRIATSLGETLSIPWSAARNIVATATGMAGALWQMAAPGSNLRKLYEQDPELTHALVDVEPRLVEILAALIRGYAQT